MSQVGKIVKNAVLLDLFSVASALKMKLGEPRRCILQNLGDVLRAIVEFSSPELQGCVLPLRWAKCSSSRHIFWGYCCYFLQVLHVKI